MFALNFGPYRASPPEYRYELTDITVPSPSLNGKNQGPPEAPPVMSHLSSRWRLHELHPGHDPAPGPLSRYKTRDDVRSSRHVGFDGVHEMDLVAVFEEPLGMNTRGSTHVEYTQPPRWEMPPHYLLGTEQPSRPSPSRIRASSSTRLS